MLAPVAAENLPATHLSQAALPDTVLYVPIGHKLQMPGDPVDPAVQDNGSQVKFNELISTF